jgi:hypothetical protein
MSDSDGKPVMKASMSSVGCGGVPEQSDAVRSRPAASVATGTSTS